MATLGKIRQQGVLLLVVVGLALLAFIVGDLVNSSAAFFSESSANVAKINGKNVKIRSYMEAIDQMTEVYKMEIGEAAIDDRITDQIHQSVWEMTVRDNILMRETEAINMTVSEAELYDLIMGKNIDMMISSRRMFFNPETNSFDPALVAQFREMIDSDHPNPNISLEQLNQLKSYWKFWEDQVRMGRLEAKYGKLLYNLLVVNSLDAKNSYNNQKTTVDFVYATKPYLTLPDSVYTASNRELKALYNKKKEQFKQEASRDLKYVIFYIEPSDEDFANAEQWINELKPQFETTTEIGSLTNANSDVTYKGENLSKDAVDADFRDFAFSGKKDDCMGPLFVNNTYKMARIVETGIMLPDSVKLRHILVQQDTEEKTQLLADSIEKAIKEGADFAVMAQTYSKMSQTATKGGEIGWVKEADLENEMAEKVMKASVNEVFQMKGSYGIQILQVMERAAETPKVKLAILERKVVPSSATQAKIFQRAKQFAYENNTPEKLEKSALEQGLSCRPISSLDINQTRVANLKNSRQIVRWAFKNEVNTVSDIFECDDKIIVAAITGANEKGYRDLESVKDFLLNEIRRDKKAEAIKQEMSGKQIADFVADVAAGYTVDTLRGITFNTPYAGSVGREPELFALASMANQGQLSQPVKGVMGVYVFNVFNKVVSDQPFDKEAEVSDLTRAHYMLPYLGMDVLKKAANIEDLRYKYF
jgi:peptidyl-prolyl cis-trans isomerase D